MATPSSSVVIRAIRGDSGQVLCDSGRAAALPAKIDWKAKADLLPVEMKLGYNVQLWKEGKQYIAHAMPLDVSSSGPTPGKARVALKEAVDLFLKTAHEAGTLEQVLAAAR